MSLLCVKEVDEDQNGMGPSFITPEIITSVSGHIRKQHNGNKHGGGCPAKGKLQNSLATIACLGHVLNGPADLKKFSSETDLTYGTVLGRGGTGIFNQIMK